jgi:hypothetical protein
MERADPHQATSGQRDDYICWIDPWGMTFTLAMEVDFIKIAICGW